MSTSPNSPTDMSKTETPAVKPTFKMVMTDPVHFLAFGFGSGLSPVAPGTFGTLVAVPLFVTAVMAGDLVFWTSLVLINLLGIYICGASARKIGVHDFGGIVWDEIAGYFITMIPLVLLTPPKWPMWAWWGIGFVLFRFFDIIKPWPIRVIDRNVHGGFGIMLDDVLAGIFSAAALAALLLL